MTTETRCVVRGVRLSVDKGRLVADLIRGKKVDQALNQSGQHDHAGPDAAGLGDGRRWGGL